MDEFVLDGEPLKGFSTLNADNFSFDERESFNICITNFLTILDFHFEWSSLFFHFRLCCRPTRQTITVSIFFSVLFSFSLDSSARAYSIKKCQKQNNLGSLGESREFFLYFIRVLLVCPFNRFCEFSAVFFFIFEAKKTFDLLVKSLAISSSKHTRASSQSLISFRKKKKIQFPQSFNNKTTNASLRRSHKSTI